MKRKGFTLVELLVVIAIIALLMGILMPALARVRQIAYRMICGTNLSGIGKAMLIYAHDYEDELPRAGGISTAWEPSINNWLATNRWNAYGLNTTDGSGGKASITASFYLLVKYAEVTPKSFICKGDTGVSEFKPSDDGAGNMDLIDLWDFGLNPDKRCSYSYHMPYLVNGTSYALTTSSEPGVAVAADRNPFLASPAGEAKMIADFNPLGNRDQIKKGNAAQHQDEGQNVLFLDSHVSFEKRSFCGIMADNIYTWMDGGDRRRGGAPVVGTTRPQAREDSFLVHGGEGSSPVKVGKCFPAGTLVWIEGSPVEISTASAGRRIDAQSSSRLTAGNASPAIAREIETVQVHDGSEGPWRLYEITLETGNHIAVADSHFFLSDSGRWVRVQELTAGSLLQCRSGLVRVAGVSLNPQPQTGPVYNLRIRGSDRYMVGRDAVVARDW